MTHVFAFAGIPAAIYDGVYDQRLAICGDEAEFVSSPAKNTTHPGSAAAQVNRLVNVLTDRLRGDHHNALADTAFAMIAVGPTTQTAALQAVFPAVLVIPVEWSLDATTATTTKQSRNALIVLLREACLLARAVFKPLTKELREKDNRTPLLLPLKNFSSSALVRELSVFHDAVAQGADAGAAIVATTQAIDRRHPPQMIHGKVRRCYVDRRRVEFHAPGSARHAYARPTSNHPDICLLAGSRRFGAPFDRCFHYDCSRGNKPLAGRFTRCHDVEANWSGKPHLNIAPNDYIRI
ncbi:hypothetical protein [Brevundimonas sp. TWP3-1-2b1]|uniref:hypothetical protein n=1 Tax=Brevundimonas sp. TWP3-1-2b1 TaxID=2804650 RepID=UPI003CEBBFA3